MISVYWRGMATPSGAIMLPAHDTILHFSDGVGEDPCFGTDYCLFFVYPIWLVHPSQY